MDEIDREWLTDMLEHARAAVTILGERDAAQLDSDTTTLFAVSHAVLILGEAANRVSPKGQTAFPGIAWSKIIGMRNRLVHAYRTRSAPVPVDTVRNHLPSLIAILEEARVEEDE